MGREVRRAMGSTALRLSLPHRLMTTRTSTQNLRLRAQEAIRLEAEKSKH